MVLLFGFYSYFQADVQSSAKPEGELPELPKVEVVDVFASTSGLEFRNSASTSTTADENQTSKVVFNMLYHQKDI